ncbi:helix-turn-helix domain-containing protein [Bernardetia sp. OM2101]|uniref:helix-turn-helix domain-containing protein n=1 Tax=Bernardetia sp. OM2101 TaxID=3344876 RepID=UPI0035CECF16
MIKDRQVFQYQNKNLIERVIICPPFRYEAIFQNEGCFIYLKSKDTKLISSDVNLTLENKDAVLLKCGTYFVDWLKKTDSMVEVLAVHLYPEILEKLYKNELPQRLKKSANYTQVKKIAPTDTISKFVESLEFYFQNPSLVSDDLLELKIKELILLLVQTKNASSVLELIEDLYSPRKSELKKIIDLHSYQNLSVEELAILCNLSVSSFKREFNSIYNESPIRFLNKKKIEKAKELLELSDLSIAEISHQVGFNDPYYFTRMFKKQEGTAPSIYRKVNNEPKIQ